MQLWIRISDLTELCSVDAWKVVNSLAHCPSPQWDTGRARIQTHLISAWRFPCYITSAGTEQIPLWLLSKQRAKVTVQLSLFRVLPDVLGEKRTQAYGVLKNMYGLQWAYRFAVHKPCAPVQVLWASGLFSVKLDNNSTYLMRSLWGFNEIMHRNVKYQSSVNAH